MVSKVEVDDGKLRIVEEGRQRKFLKQVEQITFNGQYAYDRGKPVYYVTERCVFRRVRGGLALIEVAPGIDVDRDILPNMDFEPIIGEYGEMDARIFNANPMGLEAELLNLSLPERVIYDPERNILFLNFEGMHVRVARGRAGDLGYLRAALPGSRQAGRRDHQLRPLSHQPGHVRRLRRNGPLLPGQLFQSDHPLRHQRLPARQTWARPSPRAASRRTSSSAARKRRPSWPGATATKVLEAADKLSVVNQALEVEVAARHVLEERLTALTQEEEAARHAAFHDALTGLPNRALFDNRLAHALAQARRRGWSLAVMFMDLDEFKQINDVHGHDVGDAVLKTVAERLKATTREDDTVCRHGGDEFLYLLVAFGEVDDVILVADKIARAIAAPLSAQHR
jgi:diguanylate cyclase (GGDEF)-like protein